MGLALRSQVVLARARPAVLTASAVLLCSSGVAAARRSASWVHDTTVQPERGVELEQWITEEIEGDDSKINIWWAPVVGITDNIELALPLELAREKASGQTFLDAYGMDLRFRLVTADPVMVGPFVPLIRIAAQRLVQEDAARLSGSAVLSIDATQRLRLILEAGASDVTVGPVIESQFGLAANYAVFDDLRLGAEAYAEQELDNPDNTREFWLAAGPTVSVTHGRFWATIGSPFGITRAGPVALPRLVWGIAF